MFCRSPERSKSTSPRRPLGAEPRDPAAVLEQLHKLTRRMEMAASEKDYIRAAEFQRKITVLLTRSTSNSKAEVEQGSPRQHSEHPLKNRAVRAAVHCDIDADADDDDDGLLTAILQEMKKRSVDEDVPPCTASEAHQTEGPPSQSDSSTFVEDEAQLAVDEGQLAELALSAMQQQRGGNQDVSKLDGEGGGLSESALCEMQEEEDGQPLGQCGELSEEAVMAKAALRSEPEMQNSAINQDTAICSAHEGDVDLLEAVLREMQLSATNQDTESEDDSPCGGGELAQVVMQELMQLQQIETQQMLVDGAEDAERQQDGDTPILHEVDSDCESEELKSMIAEAEALFKACSRGNKDFCETQRLRNAIWGNRALRARMETNRVLKEFYDILAEDRAEWSKFGNVQDPVYKISRELMVQYYIYCAQGDDDDLETDEVV